MELPVASIIVVESMEHFQKALVCRGIVQKERKAITKTDRSTDIGKFMNTTMKTMGNVATSPI